MKESPLLSKYAHNVTAYMKWYKININKLHRHTIIKTFHAEDYIVKCVTSVNKKILQLIEQRLLVGEKKYGNENVINDGRNFLKESLEEALDCSVYLAARLLEIMDNEEKEKNNSRHKIDTTASTMDVR
jgi:hypothetical protein